jgi:hypothetical protein
VSRSSSNFRNDLYLQKLKEVKPILTYLDAEVTLGATNMLLMQKLLFSKTVWKKINNNQSLINEKLLTLYPDIMWKSFHINGEVAWKFVNNLNTSIHTNKQTNGASKYKKQVATLQGGGVVGFLERGGLLVSDVANDPRLWMDWKKIPCWKFTGIPLVTTSLQANSKDETFLPCKLLNLWNNKGLS